jgi:hypothetical protein
MLVLVRPATISLDNRKHWWTDRPPILSARLLIEISANMKSP